jgi:sec-independent protein translocase protein TatC
MATAIRTIGHEDRLSLVDHLDELRTRLIVCVLALVAAFGVCLWQNHALLHFINRPVVNQTRKQVAEGRGPLGQTAVTQQALLGVATQVGALARTLSAPHSGLPPATQAALRAELPKLTAATARVPRQPSGDKLVTLGVGEPFTTTILVTLCFALVFTLPVILFELYGFVLPAFNPGERRIAAPLMAAIPFLFVAGAAFGYYVVLPAAVRFFLNFNSGEFNVLVQAGQYYRFAALIVLVMGIVFQVPVAILAVTRAGIVTPAQLRRARRFAIVACAALAAFLPGDAITLVLETVPLYLLYEASILLASFVVRRDEARRATADAGSPVSSAGAQTEPASATPTAAGPPSSPDPQVQQILDHHDPDLS